jgi:hypothetical protein
MIVFYHVETGTCMLAIDCGMSEITVSENKAYYRGEIVNNNMEISAYAEVPKQSVSTVGTGEGGLPIRIPKLFSELETGIVQPSNADRIAALEDALLALMGV